MSDRSASFKNSGNNQALFILGIITVLYWIIAKSINVYNYAFIGAVFELLWLPMMASAFIGPILSLVFFAKDKYNPGSLALYAAVLQAVAVFILIFLNNN